MPTVKKDKTESSTAKIKTRPGIQISNCKKGGVGKTVMSKLKASYCLELGLDFYALDADRQESFLKAYPEFALPTRFSELDKKLYINQLFESLNSVDKQLIARLNSVEKNQKKLDSKLLEVLSAFAREQENLQVISTGLLNSTSLLLKKQNQLMANADLAKKSARISVIIAWIIPAILLLLHLN